MRKGVELLEESVGIGALVERQGSYEFRLRMWLSGGDHIRWTQPGVLNGQDRLEDEGTALVTALRVNRVSMFAGLFYAVEGMRVGGIRRVRVAPHLGYGETGLPGVIPPNALLTVEIAVLSERA